MIVEMPQYPRRILLSKKQKPVYFEIRPDGQIVSTNGKATLPLKYIVKNCQDMAKLNRKYITTDWIKSEIACATLYQNKLHLLGSAYQKGSWYPMATRRTIILCTFENETLTPILGNTTQVGKPRYQRINAQDIYSGLHPSIRGNIVQQMKKFMLPFVKDQAPMTKFPVKVMLVLTDSIVNQLDEDGEANVNYSKWDLDNRAYLWHKCFMDLITTGKTGEKDKDGNTIQYFEPLIPGDDIRYVTGCGGTRFVPCHSDNRKLTFMVSYDGDRDSIKQNTFYVEKENWTPDYFTKF